MGEQTRAGGPPVGVAVWGRLGTPVESRVVESSPRSRVWHVRFSPGGRVREAVVKQLVDGPGAARFFAREVAGLRLAGRAGSGARAVAPALLGADEGERVLVLQYLSHRIPAPDWVVAYARALARLHACGTPDDVGLLPSWAGPADSDIDAFLALAEALGAAVPHDARPELTELRRRLERAPGHALLHGDPCPGNDLHTADGVRFIDFEQASLGNGLIELAYLRIGFPTCWCSTAAPPALLARAERAYRTAWSDATGTEPSGDLTDACAGWLLRGDALVQRAEREGPDHLARLLRGDWEWGTATARQRFAHRLRVVAELTAGRTDLGALHHLAVTLGPLVRDRWAGLVSLPLLRP